MILLENHTRISLAGYNTRQESNRKKVQSLLQKKKKQTERRRSTPHYSPPPPSHETDKKKKTHTHSRIRNRLRKYFSIQRRRKIDLKQTISKTTQREKEREHSKKLNARGRELERAAENELSCWRKRERTRM